MNPWLSCIILVAFACMSSGWEIGKEYVYDYNGRAAVGILELKQQTAVAQIVGQIKVQSLDDQTLAVQFSNGRLIRNGNYQGNPYYTDDGPLGRISLSTDIDGEAQRLAPSVEQQQQLEAPFILHHTRGSISSIEVSSNEPLWIVNMKKAIASKLQMDLTNVRPDGPPIGKELPELGTARTVFEDTITGDCSTTIQISQLPGAQIQSIESLHLGAANSLCKNSKVYEIYKTKDFNRCKSNRVLHSAIPPLYMCTLGSASCGEAMQRVSGTKYLACGNSASQLTIVSIGGFSDFIASPFGMKTEKIVSTGVTAINLRSVGEINSRLSAPSDAKQINSLSYSFSEAEVDGKLPTPDLTSAPEKFSVPASAVKNAIMEGLRLVARDLKESSDADHDLTERLLTVRRAMNSLSLEELRGMWEQVKTEDSVVLDLFVDCVVATGSNPTVMLIKELIEKQQIQGMKATWALAALGYFAKTPTKDLLQQILQLVKSDTVQSSKDLKQTALLSVADLLSVACDSPYLREKRFPISLMGDFCDSNDPLIVNEFLPLLVKELESADSTAADRMVALTAVGTLGTQEIIPVLLPHIRGNNKGDDTAQRTRAILALHRIMYSSPERVIPMLTSLADNIGERAEVRMASIALLLNVNAPLSLWQKLTYRTWFEPSHQVRAFTHDIIQQFAAIPPLSSVHQALSQKARTVAELLNPTKKGVPLSWSDMRSSFLKQGLGVIQHASKWRVGDDLLPVAMGLRYYYQLGPFTANPLSVFIWNYNMEDLWGGIMEKIYKNPNRPATLKANANLNEIKDIWGQIRASRRPADQRVGTLQLSLMSSINRIFDLEQLEKNIPKWIGELMKSMSKPIPVSLLKFRNLAEINMRIPSDLGLPVRFLANLPILISGQGSFKSDSSGSVQSNVALTLSWKLSTEVRVDLPDGNYVASGVDVRVDSHNPSDLNIKYKSGGLKVTVTPGDKINDLVYYHVKPYTISRHVSNSATPTTECSMVNIIQTRSSLNDWSIPLRYTTGVDIRLIGSSDLPLDDMYAWGKWLRNWDVNSYSNLGFVPLSLHNRQYHVRYLPEKTQAVSIVFSGHYVYLSKSSKKSINFLSGTSNTDPTDSLVSFGNFNDEAKGSSDRLFKNIDGGDGHLFMTEANFLQKDGSIIKNTFTLGVSQDDVYTKDYTDLRITRSIIKADRSEDVDYKICGSSVRQWNVPPAFGLSNEILYQTEDSIIHMGKSCDAEGKIHFKAKIYRDEEAAFLAKESEAGKQCLHDMENGLIDSPKCAEARDMDQTYNIYDLDTEFSNIPEPVAWAFEVLGHCINNALSPFTTTHRLENNAPNRLQLNARRNSETGNVDISIRRPRETLDVFQIRDVNIRFSPLLNTFWKVFFPLKAKRNFIDVAKDIATAGISEAKCYVGPSRIVTFDGASYNYTINSCNHVLVTDCWRKSNYIIMARNVEGRSVVRAILDSDVVEIDPKGSVTVNGVVNSLDSNSRFEIHEDKRLIAAVNSISGGAELHVYNIDMVLKVKGSHITIGAPQKLRGKSCGVCGDFNQELTGEFKTGARCTVSSGSLMAASFMADKRGECPGLPQEISNQLAEETISCRSADQIIKSDLPILDTKIQTKCNNRVPLTFKLGEGDRTSCVSSTKVTQCQPGCKPAYLIRKSLQFRCSGGDVGDFSTTLTVPSTCISV